ncbi:MAG: peptidase S8 [Anaerolineae bacterium]|nr:peptidase S8 [Anaerolineae bacterium]
MRIPRVYSVRSHRARAAWRASAALLAAALALAWTLGALSAGAAMRSVAGDRGHTDVAHAQVSSPTVAITTYVPFLAKHCSTRVDPNDPHYPSQWALQTVGAPEAWGRTRGDGVVIAIVDSGIDLTHPDLAPVLWTNAGEMPDNGLDDDGNGYLDDLHGWDYVEGDALPADEKGHGTHVAGIAAAATDNATGIAGMGWGGALMVVRVLDEEGEGDVADVADGIRYAAENGAHVINLSLGGNSIPAGTVDAAVAYAQGLGVLVVAAAGNSGWSVPFYPAAYEGVLGVGATDQQDLKAWFSNYGSYVDVAAPGVSLISTLPGGYGWLSGTSMAAPMVSGLAALVWGTAPGASWAQVAEAICAGADDLGAPGWDSYYGWGRIDALGALDALAALSSTGGGRTGERLAPAVGAEGMPFSPEGQRFRPGEVIVSLRGGVSVQGVADAEVRVLRATRQPGVYLLRVPEGQELPTAERLRERADVVDAFPNYIVVTGVR